MNNLPREKYLVAFVDILGQQESLRELDSLLESNKDVDLESYKKIMEATFGAVKYLKKTMNGFFEGFKSTVDISKYSKEKQNLVKEFIDTKIKVQRFSDCTALYLPINEKTSPRNIMGFIYAVGTTLYDCMSNGFFIRAGIDIGPAMEVGDNEIYGPVLNRAYELESKIAFYPRIVVGEKFETFLKDYSTIKTMGDVRLEMMQKCAKTCLGLIIKDVDGFLTIDYLGKNFNSVIGFVIADYHFKRSYRNVCEELDKHKKAKKSRNALRYFLLKEYFDKSKAQ